MFLFFGLPGRNKTGHTGSPSLRNWTTETRDWKAAVTNWMHSNDPYRRKCCYFWFNPEVKLYTHFYAFFVLVILAYFNSILGILIDIVFNLHSFCVIVIFQVEECLYKRFKCFWEFQWVFFKYIYLGEGRDALMHVYVWGHMVRFYYRTT